MQNAVLGLELVVAYLLDDGRDKTVEIRLLRPNYANAMLTKVLAFTF